MRNNSFWTEAESKQCIHLYILTLQLFEICTNYPDYKYTLCILKTHTRCPHFSLRLLKDMSRERINNVRQFEINEWEVESWRKCMWTSDFPNLYRKLSKNASVPYQNTKMCCPSRYNLLSLCSADTTTQICVSIFRMRVCPSHMPSPSVKKISTF